MAQAVEQALEEKRHLIVEAGTGTGKTLAYLLPVIRSGKRVIISTGTTTPLLPKGTIVHMIGYVDNSPSNKNVPDPRNWTGSGNRSVTNMFLELGNNVGMSDAQFQEEMMKRRALHPGADHFAGCPLCSVADRRPVQPAQTQQQQQQ